MSENKKRVAVFLDGANMFYTQKKGLGWFFDPARLLRALVGNNALAFSYWYHGVKSSAQIAKERFDRGAAYRDAEGPFLKFLTYAGWIVRTKEIKTIKTTEGDFVQKGNLDCYLVLDAMNTIDQYDIFVLVSGDGDFRELLDVLRARGKEVVVVSTDGYLAFELRSFVGNNYIDLAVMRNEIERVQPAKEEAVESAESE